MKVIMDIKAKKLELVQLILSTEKTAILEKVEALLRKDEDSRGLHEMSKAERRAVDRGIEEANKGEFIPHEEVVKEIRAKYKLDK